MMGLAETSPNRKLFARACRVLNEHDAYTVSVVSPTWHWDGRWTVHHSRTRFPAVLQPETGHWVAGDGTPWATLIEAIDHLDWLAKDLGI